MYKGMSIFMDIISTDLSKQMESDQFEQKNVLLDLIANYINGKSTYEEIFDVFKKLEIHPFILDRTREILELEDLPIQSDDNNFIINSNKKRKKSWETREDIRLIGGILRFGIDNWINISKYVGNNRTASQCSQRWKRNLDPRISKGHWSPDEELLLFKYVQQFGTNAWGKISSLIKTRSDVQCRYHFYQINKKIQDDVIPSDFDTCNTNNFFLENLSEIHSKIDFNDLLFDDAALIPENDQISYNPGNLDQVTQTEENFEYFENQITSLMIEKENLKKDNMILNMNNHFLRKKTTDLKNKSELKLRNKDRQISRLQEIIRMLEEMKIESPSEKVAGPMDLTDTFISSLISNAHITPCRRRYSQYIYDISYILYIHSNITYKLLRCIIPLPSEQMLQQKFDNIYKKEENNLLNADQIQFLLKELRNELSDDEDDIYATIAYDAATVDPVDSNKSNLFVFNAQPLKGTIRSKICHISQNSSGRTDNSIKSIVQKIVDAGEETKIHFLYVGTDGETGTNQIHSNFNNFVNELKTTNFDEIVDHVHEYNDLIPVSDWYHIIKDIRNRFSTNNIVMFKGAPIFNAKQINEILNLDPLVINATGQSTMRDDLALILFSSQNLGILAEYNEFCAFSFLLPFTLVNIVIQSETLTTNARYILIKIAFNVIINLRQNAQGLRSKRSKKSPNVAVRFALENSCKRILNTLIALGYAMKYFDDNLKISRLFTHTVEYIFGYMRRLCYGKDKSDVAIKALTKQQISRQILNKYNLDSLHIRGRIAVSDENIDDITTEWITELCEIAYDNIPDEIILLMEEKINYENTEISKLLCFINENTPSLIPSLNTKKRIGDAIHSRQVAYSKCKQ